MTEATYVDIEDEDQIAALRALMQAAYADRQLDSWREFVEHFLAAVEPGPAGGDS